MPRFLHTADWQLGRQYGRFAEEDASVLADARFDAVARLAELANSKQVNAVLVAGDVFDAQTVSDRTLHRCFQTMAGYAGPWLMIPGNHDAALAESVWTRAERWNAIPDNIHVLTEPRVVEFPAQGFAILPAPLTQRQTHADLTEWFDTAQSADNLLRIGLAHGSVAEQLADDIDSTNPIAADRAATARLDYLALGDWHGCKSIDARSWYSGTPEQERFKDNGAGQALIVAIDKPGDSPDVRRYSTGQYAWLKRQYNLAVATDLDAMLAELEQLPAQSVVDLTLSGQMDLAGHQRLHQALGAASGRHRSLQCHQNGLRLQPTDEDIAALNVDGYVGEVVDALREQQQGDEHTQPHASQALAILAGFLRERQMEARE